MKKLVNSRKVKYTSFNDPEMKTYVHKTTCTRIFIASLKTGNNHMSDYQDEKYKLTVIY